MGNCYSFSTIYFYLYKIRVTVSKHFKGKLVALCINTITKYVWHEINMERFYWLWFSKHTG